MGKVRFCSYKFRIYPNRRQEDQIICTFGCCRFVYNYYLSQRKEAYRQGVTWVNFKDWEKGLPKLKEYNQYLKNADESALEISLENLNLAYTHFFDKHKLLSDNKKWDQLRQLKPPQFKYKKHSRQSYTSLCQDENIRVFEKAVLLPKLGKVKCRVSKEVKGTIYSATVSRNPSGKYFVSLCCKVPYTDMNKPTAEKKCVGLDMGIKNFAVSSNGIKYPNPKYLEQSEKKLDYLKEQLNRKTRGSANWEKQRIKLARLQEHIANQRRDTLHKLSTSLVREYDVICIEDLDIKKMIENSHVSKKIRDAAWGEFHRQLKYKAQWYGKEVSVVSQYYASSQLCSVCGEKFPSTKNLFVREWVCPSCRAEHDRDYNAAKNILNEGLLQLTRS